MKELDMRISINAKALSAFKKLGAVALITATLAVCFVACKQTGNTGDGGGKSTPKHAITFGLDCPESRGFLTAKVGEKSISSGEKIEEGKEVTFTAKANAG